MVDMSIDCDGLQGRTRLSQVMPQYTRKSTTSRRLIPKSYPFTDFKWKPARPIANLISVSANDLVTGPARTLTPQKHRPQRRPRIERASALSIAGDGSYRSSSDFRHQENGENGNGQQNGTNGLPYIPPSEPWIAPSRKARADALRLSSFFPQGQRYLKNFPRACKARRTINSAITNLRRRR